MVNLRFFFSFSSPFSSFTLISFLPSSHTSLGSHPTHGRDQTFQSKVLDVLVQQNTMQGPGIANTTFIEFCELKAGKKKWPPISIARLKHCSAIERTTGKRNVACIHLDIDGAGVKDRGKFEIRFAKNDVADNWFSLLSRDYAGDAKVASHVMALATSALKDALAVHATFVRSALVAGTAAAASADVGPAHAAGFRKGLQSKAGGGGGRAGSPAGAVPPGSSALGYVSVGSGPALRAQQTQRRLKASGGGGGLKANQTQTSSTGASTKVTNMPENRRHQAPAPQQQQQQRHGAYQRTDSAPALQMAAGGREYVEEARAGAATPSIHDYENFQPGGIAAQGLPERPPPTIHPRGSATPPLPLRSPSSPLTTPPPSAARATATPTSIPPALPDESDEDEAAANSSGGAARATLPAPRESKAVATVDLRNMHIYDDVQCCSECRKSVSLGVTDDNDGSWYCAECWAQFVKDGGELTVEDAATNVIGKEEGEDARENGNGDGGGGAGSSGGGGGGGAGIEADQHSALLAQAVSGVRDAVGGGGGGGGGGTNDGNDSANEDEPAYAKFFAAPEGMESAAGGDAISAELALESLHPEVADTTEADLQEAEAAEAENAAESAASTTTHTVSYHGYSGTLASEGADAVEDAKGKLDALASFGLCEGAAEHLLILNDSGMQLIKGTDPAGEVVATLDTVSITFTHLSEEGCLSVIVTDPQSRMSICHCMDIAAHDDGEAMLQRVQVFTEGALEQQKDSSVQRKAGVSTDLTQFARKASVRLNQTSRQSAVTATTASALGGKGRGVQRMFSVKRVSQEAARNFSSRRNVKPSSDADMRAPIGIVTCNYLGSVSVPKQQGNDVVRLGLRELAKSIDFSPTDVAVVSSLYGLKVISVDASEELVEIPIRHVTYSAPIEDEKGLEPLQSRLGARWGRPVFSIIHVMPQLQSNMLELFQVLTKEDLVTIQRCISTGTSQLVATLKKRRMNTDGAATEATNPFEPRSDTGDRIPVTLAKHQVSRRGLNPIRVLGQGAFGEVWLVKERSPPAGHAAKYLAVKMVKSDSSAEDGAEFLAECEIMTLLRHPNLLRMHGVSIRQTPWLVVIDFIKYGDMHNVLRTCRAKKLPLRYAEQYYFAAQIALGMRYVSMQRLVHMDLAARNVLLSEKNVVKVADFGLTQKLAPGKTTWRLKTKMCLPQRWQSTEGMKYQVFSEKSDVWSYGVYVASLLFIAASPG